jgi:hypothetical protein
MTGGHLENFDRIGNRPGSRLLNPVTRSSCCEAVRRVFDPGSGRPAQRIRPRHARDAKRFAAHGGAGNVDPRHPKGAGKPMSFPALKWDETSNQNIVV